jgi:hypothetical protein
MKSAIGVALAVFALTSLAYTYRWFPAHNAYSTTVMACPIRQTMEEETAAAEVQWTAEPDKPPTPPSSSGSPDFDPIITPTPKTIGAPQYLLSSEFRDGAADRLAWKKWFNSLTGDEREGALYWASQRSLLQTGSCARLDDAKAVGCREAQTRLLPSDAGRKTDPEYRAGWNSVHHSTS